MLANIVEKWCLRGWYKNQKIPDLCGGAEQLLFDFRKDNFGNSLRSGKALKTAPAGWRRDVTGTSTL
ncbi:hypothetical protein [Endozoicomonas sp. SCSIO W0465]|uniref:hypothetical protein n=1 Tax=Endozoicomonas sp. SCSIO W0465 TaxID=2918516 RepID=UPI0020752303|nr:hypothetical protein [Endozoicomonas sp. SCSIO W0465]USE35515.1 hypothetical protein MJO57_26055 [Endozoicomonas sp. SCSIO W0465]